MALQPGDVVSAAAYSWGAAFAREHGDRGGRNDNIRIEGLVVTSQGNLWVCDFGDDQNIAWKRSELRFVSRPGASEPVRGSKRSRPQEREDSSDEEPPAESESTQAQIGSDSSDLDDADESQGRAGRPNHAMPELGLAESAPKWIRDDSYSFDERAKNGFHSKHPPSVVNMAGGFEHGSLFECSKHFLPMNYMEALAAEMTVQGRKKAEEDNQRRFSGWAVSTEDVLQWIGVWMYMLAFPQQASSRRSYFQPPLGGYGPSHNLQGILVQGGRGPRGLAWFEQMQSCLVLPQWQNASQTGTENGGNVERSEPYRKDDPFAPTRMFWDHLRTAFFFAMCASWLLCLDESMLRWTGRGMPGLMVILRKPTPIGLELHTLCCALCGVLIWFEVYEGKAAMAKKAFNDRFPKSIALTLRMLKPFFGSVSTVQGPRSCFSPPPPATLCLLSDVFVLFASQGRVLIADSWFGSVACALALFQNAIFSIMNVKTAHKGYPKDELLAEVGEIKGNTPEAKALRAEKRGKHAAFRQEFSVPGNRKVTVVAAGHNKKVPLLLVGTHSSLVEGKTHTKVWHTNMPDGTTQYFKKETKQPEMHQLYRDNMNHVDLHNKLRQGVVAMADVWQTTSWVERHFAEGLGLWEVNVYKALQYFQAAKWKDVSHNEFRARLAFALMSLGKVAYPCDAPRDQRRPPHTPGFLSPPNTTTCPPPSPLDFQSQDHVWVYEKKLYKRCSYCGTQCHSYCRTCRDLGAGTYFACSSITRGCMAAHAAGCTAKHYSFSKKKRSGGASDSTSGVDSSGGSASEDTRRPTSVAPAESPNSVARRAARAVAASNGSRSARSADASSSSTS